MFKFGGEKWGRKIQTSSGGNPIPIKAEEIQQIPNFGKPLTEPSEGKFNSGHDNKDNELIMSVGDVLCRRYVVYSLLGKGVYGQVVKCKDMKTSRDVAVKVIKNHPDFNYQAKMEIEILEELRGVFNLESKRIIELLHQTKFRKHLVLVFELLGENLYEVLQKVEFEGVDIRHVSAIGKQCLKCLNALWDQNIIHCDMKPENVLIVPQEEEKGQYKEVSIKVIDFGSATFEHLIGSFYVQSRFYRAPEVLLGIEYDTMVDVWSLACILAEMYLGLPIFAGSTVYDQVAKIVKYLGSPSEKLIESGKLSMDYFENRYVCFQQLVEDNDLGDANNGTYKLKSYDLWALNSGKNIRPLKAVFEGNTVEEIVMRKRDTERIERDLQHFPKLEEMQAEELEERKNAFVDFLQGMLKWDKNRRWTPKQALQHPFITGEKFTEKFRPTNYNVRSYIPSSSTSSLTQLKLDTMFSQPISAKRNTVSILIDESPSSRRKKPKQDDFIPRNSWYNKPQLGQSPGFGGMFGSPIGSPGSGYMPSPTSTSSSMNDSFPEFGMSPPFGKSESDMLKEKRKEAKVEPRSHRKEPTYSVSYHNKRSPVRREVVPLPSSEDGIPLPQSMTSPPEVRGIRDHDNVFSFHHRDDWSGFWNKSGVTGLSGVGKSSMRNSIIEKIARQSKKNIVGAGKSKVKKIQKNEEE